MKVVLVCNSDLTGGAAVVTHRLMAALRDQGVEATMLVMNKAGDDLDVHVMGSALGRKLRFVGERAYIFAHNGFNRTDLFKVSMANTGFDISRHRLVKEADAVILSWVNQGLLSLKGVKRLVDSGKRVLWVMHDMWCMTGCCHHALDCEGYMTECGHCRYIKDGAVDNDLSRLGWRRKKNLYGYCPGLTMVAVSNWLAGCAGRSSLLSGHDVRVIPNVFPDKIFYIEPRGIELPHGIDLSKRLIVMGAARLDDPIKDFPTAIAALNFLAEKRQDIVGSCQAVFYGDLRDRSLLDRLSFPHVHIGRIADAQVLRELFSRADVVLSTSLFETLPGTIIEGMAGGCTAVTTGNGGQRDIVDDGVSGYITSSNPEDIAGALSRAIDNPCDRFNQHEIIAERFGAESVALKFLECIRAGSKGR